MTKPILLAGLLGGLLGGVVSFAASRWIKPAEPAKPNAGGKVEAANPEAHAVAEAFVAKLKATKYDDFLADLRIGMVRMTDKEFEAFKQNYDVFRATVQTLFGTPTGEIEFVRESVVGADLARYVYLQKFPRGAVVWVFTMYRTTDGWRPNSLVWSDNLQQAFPAGS